MAVAGFVLSFPAFDAAEILEDHISSAFSGLPKGDI